MTGIIHNLLRILGLVGTAPASYRDGGLFLARWGEALLDPAMKGFEAVGEDSNLWPRQAIAGLVGGSSPFLTFPVEQADCGRSIGQADTMVICLHCDWEYWYDSKSESSSAVAEEMERHEFCC